MSAKKYIKKIELNSDEWKEIQNIHFDDNFCLDKNKEYKVFFLNQDNKNKLKIESNNNLDKVEYFNLRDYQKEALNYILRNRKVSLNLPVRFGKSYISITSILNNKKNSIIFVNVDMIENIKKILIEHGEKMFLFIIEKVGKTYLKN